MSAKTTHLMGLPKKHKLTNLHLDDVDISSPTDGQVLTYEQASALWKNKSPTGGRGFSGEHLQINYVAWVFPATWTYVPNMVHIISGSGLVLVIAWFNVANLVASTFCRGQIKLTKNGVNVPPFCSNSFLASDESGRQLALMGSWVLSVANGDVLRIEAICPEGVDLVKVVGQQAVMDILKNW